MSLKIKDSKGKSGTLTKIRWRCPICKLEAEIDKKKKVMVIYFPLPGMPETPSILPVTVGFPKHVNCELAKPVHLINLKKLEKIEVKK